MATCYGHVDFFKNNFCFRVDRSRHRRHVIDRIPRARPPTTIRIAVDRQDGEPRRARAPPRRPLRHQQGRGVHRPLPLAREPDRSAYAAFIGARAGNRTAEEEPSEIEVPRLRVEGLHGGLHQPGGVPRGAESRRSRPRRRRREALPAREPERDVLAFLLDNAPLERWERDILEIIREEAYYFVPQMQTKIMNEGWACIHSDSLCSPIVGCIRMQDARRRRCRYRLRRRRIAGTSTIATSFAITPRSRCARGAVSSSRARTTTACSWPMARRYKRLDELAVGERIAISGGHRLWASDPVCIAWESPRRIGMADVATEAGVDLSTVYRHQAGRRVRSAAAVAAALSKLRGAGEPGAAPGLEKATAGRGSRRSSTVISQPSSAISSATATSVASNAISA